MNYKLIKIKLNEEIINLTFIDDLNDSHKLKVTLDDYLDFKLKENIVLDNETFNKLKEKEKYTLAYLSALRRLAIKDYSVYKMKQSLKQKYDLTKEDLDLIIKDLIKKDLLNDERYILSKSSYLSNNGYSYKMIINKLKDDGVNFDLINKLVKEDKNEESIKLNNKANKYLKTIKGKSVLNKKQLIMQKLINDGFNIELSKKIVETLNFNEDKNLEKENLIKEYNKVCLKYKKKYQDYELKNKIINSLMLKGYRYDDILDVLNNGGKN